MSRKHKDEQAQAQQTAEPVQEEAKAAEAAAESAQEPEQPAEPMVPAKDLEAAKAKAAEYLAIAQRAQADYANMSRRNETVRADAYADGQRNVAAAMLSVLDNLERAVTAAQGAEGETVTALKSGVELTLRQLTDAFKKLGIEPVDRTGEPFDPAVENAVLQGTSEDGKPGTVCQVLQKGYTMGGKLLRPAMVKVVPED